MLSAAAVGYAQDQASEAKIKAAYINQFSNFVRWPESVSLLHSKLSICVLGDEDVSTELQPITKLPDNGISISLDVVTRLADIDSCNMLYIAKTEARRLESILRYMHKKPILTISSIEDFAIKGGMIGFVLVGSKVRLEVNRQSVKDSQLDISARLLEVSRVVDNEGLWEQRK